MEEITYYYKDNWSGDIHQFSTLREAKKEAKKEDGNSIAIFKGLDCVEIVKSNGRIYN
jgi:hypothetical protein